MRNLKLKNLQNQTQLLPNFKFITFDTNINSGTKDERIYFATNEQVYAFDPPNGKLELLKEVHDIVGCEYLAINNELCLAKAAGEIVLLNPQTKELTEGIYCDVGIEIMSWSPDQESVVFITKQLTVEVMNSAFEPINVAHSLTQDGLERNPFLSVGWGKKETQFHGSEGKLAAKSKDDVQKVMDIDALPKHINISWRGDSAFFAISFVNPEFGRVFKVFDKEGLLLFVSEKAQGLQWPIAWRPSGNWIAVPQQLPNKSAVALFEKNGLRHREIVLPFDIQHEAVLALSWNEDSDVLYVQTQVNVSGDQNVYIYTMCNYHWYVKQQLHFAKQQSAIATLKWDNRMGEEKTLHIVLENGEYVIYRWLFDVEQLNDRVAVIDGHKLLLTDFNKAAIPPPMCGFELQHKDFINFCGFFENSQEDLCIYLYDAKRRLALQRAEKAESSLKFEQICVYNPASTEDFEKAAQFSHLLRWSEHKFIAVTSSALSSTIYVLCLDNAKQLYTKKSALNIEGVVNTCLKADAAKSQLIAVTQCGKIYDMRLHANDALEQQAVLAQLPPNHTVNVVKYWSGKQPEQFGLVCYSKQGHLFIDDQQVACEVTSFCLEQEFLCYTQLQMLYLMRLSDRKLVCERKMERGGRLVCCSERKAHAVLQMPRGNLEVVSPRVLVLKLLAAHLQQQQYYAAMDLLRKHRLNLNILCDYNLQEFVQNLNEFVKQLRNINWLNVFINDLRDENVAQTIYKLELEGIACAYPENFTIERKVSYLCERLVSAMQQQDAAHYCLAIITAYVRMGEMEKALQLIQDDNRDALNHMLYLINVDELFNLALGTYNFKLVLLVAQRSQKDPKEFLALINEWKALEINYRKFKIDEHLKRYEKAIENIAKCGEEHFTEALRLIKAHQLYEVALRSYAEGEDCHKRVCIAYGDHFRNNGKLSDASIMYERGGDLQQALMCARNVLDWKRAIALGNKMEADVKDIARRMFPGVKESGRYIEAYQLACVYNASLEDRVCTLTAGNHYLMAFEEVYKNQDSIVRAELLDVTNLALNNYVEILLSNFSEDKKKYTDYKERLLTVREAKLNAPVPTEDANIDECDLLSDITSVASSRHTSGSRASSGKTFRSRKNRRKYERKLLNLKPGNQYEEIALIDTLYNLVTQIFNQEPHVHETCKALKLAAAHEKAAELKQQYIELFELVSGTLDEIWIPALTEVQDQSFSIDQPIDYEQMQNEQLYRLLDPLKRLRPIYKVMDW